MPPIRRYTPFVLIVLVLLTLAACQPKTSQILTDSSQILATAAPSTELPVAVEPGAAETQAPAAPGEPATTYAAGPVEPSALPGWSNTWQGLPFDQFLEESYQQIMRRDPELITELGLTQPFGMGNDMLRDRSAAYTQETYALIAEIYASLQGYQQAVLTREQQLSYEIYAWYLDDILRGQQFEYYSYPITHFIIGQQNQLLQFFTDIHPIGNLQDAEDYLTRLSQIDTWAAQISERLSLSEAAGVITPRFILEWSLGDIRDLGYAPARTTPFYTSFATRLAGLDLSQAEREALLLQAENEITNTVVPAFAELADYLQALSQRAPDEDGAWQHPNGEAYYAYLVRHYTTTDLTPDEIHALGLQELERIQAEMGAIFTQLGYPVEDSLPTAIGRVVQESGIISGQAIVGEYERIISEAEAIIQPAFDRLPQAKVIVIGGPSGGYYLPPAVDGSRPGAFYAQATGSEQRFGMPTLAYHEAIPGHHLQLAIAQELELPVFRRGGLFTAYVEGWALYAERLMADLGVYAGDPYGDIGRLQAEAFRAARLVVDTGIHAKGWTFNQAVDFMVANTGLPRQMVQFEVGRYIAWPGQALAYKIGMIEILDLRQQARDSLGTAFELSAFHHAVLQNGAVPLEILEQLVTEYIAAAGG